MKKEFVMLLVLVLSGLVVAQGSEISTSFNVGGAEVGQDYVPSASFWDVYGGYVIGAIIVLIIVIIVLKMRTPKVVKRVRKRKVKKRK